MYIRHRSLRLPTGVHVRCCGDNAPSNCVALCLPWIAFDSICYTGRTCTDIYIRGIGTTGLAHTSANQCLQSSPHERCLFLLLEGSFLVFGSLTSACACSDNYIGGLGAAVLANALKMNESLRELFIKGNELGNEGIKAICQALKERKVRFKALDVGNNRSVQSQAQTCSPGTTAQHRK